MYIIQCEELLKINGPWTTNRLQVYISSTIFPSPLKGNLGRLGVLSKYHHTILSVGFYYTVQSVDMTDVCTCLYIYATHSQLRRDAARLLALC